MSPKVTKASVLDEAAIMDVLLKHGGLLTCFNCGKSLTEVDGDRVHEHGKDRFIAKLVLEPGENNALIAEMSPKMVDLYT